MVSLARASLANEWRRYLAAVVAVAFAGLMLLVQLGLLLGLFSTLTMFIDKSSADLWVGVRDTKSVDVARSFYAGNSVFLLQHPEVESVEEFQISFGDWRRPDGAAISGVLAGIDVRSTAMMLAKKLPVELRLRLDEPGAVIVDEADLENLDVKVGGVAEINGKRVKVVGAVHGIRAMGGSNFVASLATVRYIDVTARDSDTVSYLLVKLKNPQRAAEVRDELQPAGVRRPFDVWMAEEFSKKSTNYWLFESGVGVVFLFSSLLGLLVGCVVTSQTLMAAVAGSIREYAMLRALGVPAGALRWVVMEQSSWIALLGFFMSSALCAVVMGVAHANHVAMTLPWWAYPLSGALILLIALLSGLYALRALRAAAPITLLR
jgi:putative ABC transport system permease protein